MLDVALARCDDDTRARFALALAARTAAPQVSTPSGDLDHESWVDDIERAAAALAGQSFAFASALLQRWTAVTDPHRLGERGHYLYARSTTLLGDLRRDQGMISGLLSAVHSYTIARSVYQHFAGWCPACSIPYTDHGGDPQYVRQAPGVLASISPTLAQARVEESSERSRAALNAHIEIPAPHHDTKADQNRSFYFAR
ncbi:hypothetical protein [Catenuloplanes atrovinosus]|uniref:Uncharacterized protein n=1 Tax=Catenuloplanes atrovinosus TaxID=137266 RepID=A0AAE3YSC2_9ACTN|nr:hypothetical protein [Catenuloplanes atrovinosus]MDR7277750.1 hypothetical protein [Catenuloplanes atrovinosus]